MKHNFLFVSGLLILAFVLAGCAPQAAPTTAPAAVEPTQSPTQSPTESPTAVPTSAGTAVQVGQNDTLGSFLVDQGNMSLYVFLNDSPGTSNCYDACAQNWPPLLTVGTPVSGNGIGSDLLGTAERTDGTVQVTYNGWPLYYFAGDAAPGDANGQGVKDIWFVISPSGDKMVPERTKLQIGQNDALGSFLIDEAGMSLYIFLKDDPGTSNCYDACAQNWPPLLAKGESVPDSGMDGSLLGKTERTDGTEQVTYNGWPLYYFAGDAGPGDVNGQGINDVWFVVSPAGEGVKPGTALVKTQQDASVGSFLVDEGGMSLYIFMNDTPNTSSCYDACAKIWPPLLLMDGSLEGDGINNSLLGTTERTDGTVQVTYNGWPLYYYASDTAPGDMKGQGFKGVWYVISPAGDILKAQDNSYREIDY